MNIVFVSSSTLYHGWQKYDALASGNEAFFLFYNSENEYSIRYWSKVRDLLCACSGAAFTVPSGRRSVRLNYF
jgi:hypothetical protein